MIRAGFWEKVRARGLAGIVKAAYGIVKAAYRRAFDPNSYLTASNWDNSRWSEFGSGAGTVCKVQAQGSMYRAAAAFF